MCVIGLLGKEQNKPGKPGSDPEPEAFTLTAEAEPLRWQTEDLSAVAFLALCAREKRGEVRFDTFGWLRTTGHWQVKWAVLDGNNRREAMSHEQ